MDDGSEDDVEVEAASRKRTQAKAGAGNDATGKTRRRRGAAKKRGVASDSEAKSQKSTSADGHPSSQSGRSRKRAKAARTTVAPLVSERKGSRGGTPTKEASTPVTDAMDDRELLSARIISGLRRNLGQAEKRKTTEKSPAAVATSEPREPISIFTDLAFEHSRLSSLPGFANAGPGRFMGVDRSLAMVVKESRSRKPSVRVSKGPSSAVICANVDDSSLILNQRISGMRVPVKAQSKTLRLRLLLAAGPEISEWTFQSGVISRGEVYCLIDGTPFLVAGALEDLGGVISGVRVVGCSLGTHSDESPDETTKLSPPLLVNMKGIDDQRLDDEQVSGLVGVDLDHLKDIYTEAITVCDNLILKLVQGDPVLTPETCVNVTATTSLPGSPMFPRLERP